MYIGIVLPFVGAQTMSTAPGDPTLEYSSTPEYRPSPVLSSLSSNERLLGHLLAFSQETLIGKLHCGERLTFHP